MKILMTTHYFASHQGGIEIVAGQLFRELAALGQEIVWMATDAMPPPEPCGSARVASLHALNMVERKIGLPFPIPTPASLMKIWEEVRRADVVIIHDCLYLTNVATYVFARMAGVPVIVIQHIGLVPYSSHLLRGVMKLANAVVTRTMLRGARQVVFISETTKLYFARLRFRHAPVVIFNGVDANVFRPANDNQEKAFLRGRFGFVNDRPVVLFVGRFVEKKGLSVLKRMAEMGQGYTWALAGWGPLDPREWHAANVRVFSDLHGAALAELYRASDLLVLPSIGEGFPLVVQEALACGLPVVCGSETASADRGLAELVRGAELLPGNDDVSAGNFIAAIDGLIASPATLIGQCNERRNFAVRNYSWRKAAQQYLAIAAQLSSEKPLPRPATEEKSGTGEARKLGARGASL